MYYCQARESRELFIYAALERISSCGNFKRRRGRRREAGRWWVPFVHAGVASCMPVWVHAGVDGAPGGVEGDIDCLFVNTPDMDTESPLHLPAAHPTHPCTQAARVLGIGHSGLKRACRRLNCARWPYRKLTSLNYVHEVVSSEANMPVPDREVSAQ